ncbi:hypothetical protein GTA08_BOTSDO01493 [Neofusicoccum parvum]|uniref:Uncharacterized protein n=1 Tax=Neofusicoccum parvum TaxID=310453 RepID=A0ACB5SB83_9PEZI|nr:hypothetical protein GTA08_BOTSDO01493 [Neofusicoccum parvum]
MHSLSGLVFAGMLASAGTALAQLHFTTDATLHDYPSLADGRANNNPPWCEMNYDSLDLNSVTAYCAIDKSTCGACLNVCGSAGCKYMLAIDQCSRGDGLLDISTGAGPEICGDNTGHHQVTATQVDAHNCEHIWNGKMFFDYQAPYGGLATLKSILDGDQAATSSVSIAEYTKVPDATTTAKAVAPSSTFSTTSSVAVETQPSVMSAPVETIQPVSQPAYSAPVESASSVVSTTTNQPWSVPSVAAYSSIAPFGNSSANASVPAAIPTTYDSTTGALVDAESNVGATKSCEDSFTVTTTVPGSTVYVTVTSTYGNGAAVGSSTMSPEEPSSATDGVLAETAAGSTSKATTTVRSTSTLWITRTTTITGCPSGVTNCPESLQTTGLTTVTSAVETTVVPVANPTGAYSYPSVSGVWNGTQAGMTHTPLSIPDAAAASADAYAAEVKARGVMAAPLAKRSAASTASGSIAWEAVAAVSGLAALFVLI